MTKFKRLAEREGQSVYYGLRYGSITGIRRKRKNNSTRIIPTFDTALELATATELQKAITYFETDSHGRTFAEQRIERMKQRLAELNALPHTGDCHQ